MGAELDLVVVDREVGEAAARLEKPLARVAVALVLLDRIIDGLFGQAVLELKSGDRQAVDKQAQVQGKLLLVVAVTELTRDTKAVGSGRIVSDDRIVA